MLPHISVRPDIPDSTRFRTFQEASRTKSYFEEVYLHSSTASMHTSDLSLPETYRYKDEASPSQAVPDTKLNPTASKPRPLLQHKSSLVWYWGGKSGELWFHKLHGSPPSSLLKPRLRFLGLQLMQIQFCQLPPR